MADHPYRSRRRSILSRRSWRTVEAYMRCRGVGLLLAILCAGALAGCTISVESKYAPAMPRLQDADRLRDVRLGIGKFHDSRSMVKADDPDTLAYVARQGNYKFGLTYNGQEMIPVSDLVQKLFVMEFERAGIQSVPLPEILGKGALPAMRAAGEKARVDHVLGGTITVFEWENKDKFWTLEAHRRIAMEIQLMRVATNALVLDTAATGKDENDEGLGVKHTTNANALLNRVFRLVVFKVVEEVAEKLALDPRDIDVRLAFVGPAVAP